MNPRNRTKAKVSADEGMAMILVLSIAVVLMLLGLASITMANGALNSSSGHVSFERTIHLAEEGIDQTMARLQKDRSYSTVATVPTFATVAEEEAWARAQLAAVPEADLKQTNRGQVAVVKPAVREGSGVEAKVVYAAAWTPSRANATRERVVKTEYIFSAFAPSAAILVGGDLRFFGNANVIGGDVHANGDAYPNGTSCSIGGSFTASESMDPPSGTCTVGGTQGAPYPPHFIPRIESRTMWQQHHQNPTYQPFWYDLCDDGNFGEVRQPAISDTIPCSGMILQTFTKSSDEFRGWSFKKSSKTWETKASYPGVYYIMGGQASISGSPGTDGAPFLATVLTEGVPASPCNASPADIVIQGGPKMGPFITGLQLISAGDIYINGGSDAAKFQGLLAAAEQVDVSGTVELKGSVIAEDRCDTTGSKVASKQNAFSGNFTLTYDPDLDLDLAPYIRTTLWLEF